MKIIIVLLALLISACQTPPILSNSFSGIKVQPSKFFYEVGNGVESGVQPAPQVITDCTVNGYGELASANCLSHAR